MNWLIVFFKMSNLQNNSVSNNLFQSRAGRENRLRGSGHEIAAARLDVKLNAAGWMSEKMGGLSYFEFPQTLEEKVDEDWAYISSSLEEIHKSLFSTQGCLINITVDGKNIANKEKVVSTFVDMLPTGSSIATPTWNARLPLVNEAIIIPTQVNHVGKAASIYDAGYKLDGSAYVISKHISNTWLWDRVRVSGGAYGGFCEFDTHSGTIGDVDAYQLPDAKCYSSMVQHLLGITGEERQGRREEILSTRLKDFKEFVDAMDAIKDKGVAVVVTSSKVVDAANKERPNLRAL